MSLISWFNLFTSSVSSWARGCSQILTASAASQKFACVWSTQDQPCHLCHMLSTRKCRPFLLAISSVGLFNRAVQRASLQEDRVQRLQLEAVSTGPQVKLSMPTGRVEQKREPSIWFPFDFLLKQPQKGLPFSNKDSPPPPPPAPTCRVPTGPEVIQVSPSRWPAVPR